MRKFISVLFALVLVAALSLAMTAPAGAVGPPTEVWVDDDADPEWYDETHFHTIQEGVDAVAGSTVHVLEGTYSETLNLLGKALTIEGAGADATIVDASSHPGVYAIRNFGNSTTIRNLKLIGNDNYGFKVSGVSGITLESIRVENSGRTGVDLKTVNVATLTDIEVLNTTAGFGVMICDSNNVAVTNVSTSGNAWGGVSVQTKDSASDSIAFSGNFDAQEDNPLLLEKDPPTYFDITNVLIPSKFGYVVYAFRVGDDYEQWFYQETLDDAKAFAGALMAGPFTYSDMTIYDIAEENYYVIEGMNIQDAVDAASGTTINVAAGTYTEAILVDKPLTLRGATAGVNKNGYTVPENYAWDDTVESIINHPNPSGGYTTIVDIVDTDNVTFEGFVVQELNAVANLNTSLIRVYAHTRAISNILVRNNIIGPNTNITAQDGAQGRMGLYIVNHPYNDNGVINSTFSGNKIFDCKGNGNNVFIWSSYYAYGAPGPASMSGTVIEDNEIYGSHRSGIETAGGYSGLAIRNNKIYGNSGLASDDATALKYGNGIVLIRGSSDVVSGANALGPEDLTIEDNNIYNNEKNAIYGGPMLTNCTVTGNEIRNNGWDGIRVDLEGTYHASEQYGSTSNVAAHFNNIYDNTGYGVQVLGTPTNGFVLDAENNWWGTKGKGAIKKMVSGNVDFDPWIGAGVKNSKSKKTKTDDDTVDATDKADTKVVKKGKGTPTITVTEYTDNPGDGAPGGFTSAGKYIDVHLDDTTDVEEIEIRNYYTLTDIAGLNEDNLRLSWWDGTAWVLCSPSGATPIVHPTYKGYIWAIIRASGATPGSIPTLDDLKGAPFMSMGMPPAPPGWGAAPAPTPPPGTTLLSGLVTANGIFVTDVTAQSEDGRLRLIIDSGTRGLTKDRKPLRQITIVGVKEPPTPPEDAYIIGLAYDIGPAGATFDPPARLTFSFDPNQLPESTEDVVLAYYTPETGWEELETERHDGIAGGLSSLVSGVSHFTIFSVLAKLLPPAFEVSSFDIRPSQATIGETITIVIEVTNTGGIKGSYTPKLTVDGIIKAVREIALDPGESKTVSFELTALSLGEYQVEINGLTGELSIVSPPAEPPQEEEAPPTPTTNWWLIGGILAGIALILVIVFIRVLWRY